MSSDDLLQMREKRRSTAPPPAGELHGKRHEVLCGRIHDGSILYIFLLASSLALAALASLPLGAGDVATTTIPTGVLQCLGQLGFGKLAVLVARLNK